MCLGMLAGDLILKQLLFVPISMYCYKKKLRFDYSPFASAMVLPWLSRKLDSKKTHTHTNTHPRPSLTQLKSATRCFVGINFEGGGGECTSKT